MFMRGAASDARRPPADPGGTFYPPGPSDSREPQRPPVVGGPEIYREFTVKKHLIILVAALLAAIALAACAAPATTQPAAQPEAPTGQAQPNPPAEQPGLSGTKWNLTDLNGTAPIADRVPTLEFGADGQATGNGSCNQYFGSYTVDGGTLNFGQLGSTMMACEEPVMQQEISFLQTLGTAAIFTVAGDTLTITTAADATLVFTRAS